MAEEYVKLVKIGLDPSVINESIKNADRLTIEINKLKAAQKESGVQDAETTGKIKALTQERNKNIEVVKQANILTNAATKSNEELRAQLSILTAQYNKLTKEEKENTEAGQQMGKTIRSISDELKANEKAVGDNRRNVGNYTDSIKEALEGTGSFGKGLVGMVSGLQSATVASLQFIATPLGAVIAAIALAVGLVVGAFKLFTESLNRTEDGAAALTGVMNVFKGIMGGVLKAVEPIALFLVDGLAKGFEQLGAIVEKASKTIQSALKFLGLENAANGLAKLTDSIKETSIATAQLAKAEAELNKITREQNKLQLEYQNRAEKLRQIRDDESKSIKDRMQANKDLGKVLTEQSNAEMALAKRSLEIANLRIKADGASTENLDKKAEAELKIAEIEERITSQRSEQLTNENSLIRDGIALVKEANAKKIEAAKKEKELTEQAKAELIKRYQDERTLIDEMAETKRNNAILNIANAEQQAEAIAAIDRQALLDKIASIDEETIAETASNDAIGASDKEKYAKQLAERAKYEAQLAMMDRAAKAEAFANQIDLLNGQEQLDIQAAELSISNENELQNKKYQIALNYAQKRMELMRKSSLLDGALTDKEIQNLQAVENTIKGLQATLANPEAPTFADAVGLSPEDEKAMQMSIQMIESALSTIQQAINQDAEQRLTEIDQRSQAEIAAIEASTLGEEQKDAKIKAIEKKAAQERYKIELQQFKSAKAISLIMAIIQTAQAVMAAFTAGASLGPAGVVAGPAMAAAAGILGAVQIGLIASQKPPPPPAFASGGYVRGAGSGTSDSINAKLSNGESVNNARSTAKYGHIFSALNAAEGGVDWYKGEGYAQGGLVRKFASGGIALSSETIMRENEQAQNLTQSLMLSQPVLVLEEFQNVQGRQVRTEQNLQV